MTRSPSVKDAKLLCKSLGARGIIVLAFGAEEVGGASYGETRLECADLAKILDELVDEFLEGKREIWSGRRACDLPSHAEAHPDAAREAREDVLRFVAQSVHQAYHENGIWQECPKSTCRAVADALGEKP